MIASLMVRRTNDKRASHPSLIPSRTANSRERTRGESRSPEWPEVREAHLKEQPCCQACGATSRLNVHHKRPFHLHPELELVDSNLITLCEGAVVNCHLLYGHLRDWAAYNPDVEHDAEQWREKIKDRPMQ